MGIRKHASKALWFLLVDSRLRICNAREKPCVVCYQQTYPHYPQVRMARGCGFLVTIVGFWVRVKFLEEFLRENFGLAISAIT